MERMFDVMVYLKSGKSLVNIVPLPENTVYTIQESLKADGRINIQTAENQVTIFSVTSVDYIVVTEIVEEVL